MLSYEWLIKEWVSPRCAGKVPTALAVSGLRADSTCGLRRVQGRVIEYMDACMRGREHRHPWVSKLGVAAAMR